MREPGEGPLERSDEGIDGELRVTAAADATQDKLARSRKEAAAVYSANPP